MRWRAWTWMLFALLLVVVAADRFWPQPPIETDLLALLPPTERNPLAEQAAARLGRLTGERAVFLVGLPQPEQARAAAGLLAEGLASGKTFRRVVSRIPPPDPGALLDLYAPYRAGLAAPEHLAAADYQALLAVRLASPFGGGALPLSDDPFGLFEAWLGTLPFQQLRLGLEDGWLTAPADGRNWVLVSAELAGSAFDPALQGELQARLPSLEESLRQRWPAIQILRVGAVFHATAARTSAQQEMHFISLGSLLGIVFLLLLVYRSPGPLALGLLSVGVGLCTAVLATTTAFGHLHLMTLVFGASLIGEAIDYAIQYFSARLGAGPDWDARRGLAAVLPGIAIALATSVVGYAALAFTPFPALRQIALFAISGLAAAWLTVVLVLPWWLARPAKPAPAALLRLPVRWLGLWRARVNAHSVLAAASLLLAAAAAGWLQLTVNDDVRQLIQPPPELERQETRLRSITGLEAGSQFFLVEGVDSEQVLLREEALSRRLAAAGIAVQAASRFVPSCQRQNESRGRLRAALADQRAALEETGFRPEAAKAWLDTVKADPGCLKPEAWLASPVSAPFRHLWLDPASGRAAAVVLPSGYRDAAVLAAAATGLPGVILVDKPGAVSRLFGEYRRLAGYVLVAATLLIFALLAWRYGLRGGAAILLPTLLGQAVALGILGHAGVALNLFNVLALLLVLGVGINYAIFLLEGLRGGEGREAAAFIGVALSAATTLLSFGLLSFSAMPALAGFGITLALGIGIAILLAPSVLVLTEASRPECKA